MTESSVLDDVLIHNARVDLVKKMSDYFIENSCDIFDVSEPAGYGAGFAIDYQKDDIRGIDTEKDVFAVLYDFAEKFAAVDKAAGMEFYLKHQKINSKRS